MTQQITPKISHPARIFLRAEWLIFGASEPLLFSSHKNFSTQNQHSFQEVF